MCGRYTIFDTNKIKKRFEVDDSELLDKLKENYNVAPGQTLPVVVEEENKRQLDLMRWGLIPFWAKDPSIGYKMINARAETIFEKPAWRGVIRHHRCLVPANGFYEWKKEADGKQPYLIHPKDDELFAFGGISSSWTDKQTGEIVNTFSIVTTSPNKEMAKIHDRMPVILDKKDEARWLDPKADKPEDIADLLNPAPNDSLEIYKVSREVNNAKNNDKSLIVALPDK